MINAELHRVGKCTGSDITEIQTNHRREWSLPTVSCLHNHTNKCPEKTNYVPTISQHAFTDKLTHIALIPACRKISPTKVKLCFNKKTARLTSVLCCLKMCHRLTLSHHITKKKLQKLLQNIYRPYFNLISHFCCRVTPGVKPSFHCFPFFFFWIIFTQGQIRGWLESK